LVDSVENMMMHALANPKPTDLPWSKLQGQGSRNLTLM